MGSSILTIIVIILAIGLALTVFKHTFGKIFGVLVLEVILLALFPRLLILLADLVNFIRRAF